jgi:uncharacterized repeat protein (TIGR01451 family)
MIVLTFVLASYAHAGMNPDGKVAVHVLSHENRTCGKAFPVIAYCGEIVTTYGDCGDVDFFPVFFGLTGYTGVHYGLLWPGSGSCFFTSCSDLVIGQIELSGDGIAQAWTDCHMEAAVIPGWGWIATEEPGLICVDVHPGNNTLEIIDCNFEEESPRMSFCAGVCGEAGMDPCEEPPLYVALDVDIESSIGSGCIFAGNDMTYTISYGNSANPGTVNGVVLTCGYSPYTLLISASGNGQAIYGGRVRWDLGTLSVGESGSVQLTVRVKQETLLGTVLPVTAVIGCSEAPDSTVADSTMVCMEPPPPYVALDVDIESSVGGGCIFVGDDMTYTISYGNSENPRTVDGVLLTCRYSPYTLLLSASGNGQAIYGGRVRWDLGTLSVGESGSVQLTVRVKQETLPGTVLPVTAVIGCNEAPDSTVADSTMVCVEDLAPLGLSKDDNVGEDEKVPVGDHIVYTIAFDNAGNSTDVNNVRVVDYLSSLSHFVSASDGGMYDSGSRTVTWEAGMLPGGGRDSVELTTRVGYGADEWDTIINSCSVKGDETRTTRINERTEVRLAKVAIYVRPHAHWHKCTVDTPHIDHCSDIREDSDSCDVTVYPVFFDFPEFQAFEYSMVWPDDWGSMTFISCSDATIGSIVHPWDSVVQSWGACRGGGLVMPAVCHLTATDPGQIRVAENWNAGRIGITTCRGNTYNVMVSFPGGVCGENVDAPCGYPTRAVPTTWGKIKYMFR